MRERPIDKRFPLNLAILAAPDDPCIAYYVSYSFRRLRGGRVIDLRSLRQSTLVKSVWSARAISDISSMLENLKVDHAHASDCGDKRNSEVFTINGHPWPQVNFQETSVRA